MARLHGLSRDAWKRYGVGAKWLYSVEFSGWKFNTTDINSALGRVQLRKLDQFEKRRRHAVGLYNKLLGLKNKGTHLYPILVENRNKFFAYMQKNEIGCSFHFTPLHLQSAFLNYKTPKLPNTEYIGARVVTLPLDATISDKEVKRVAQLVLNFKDQN
jgi:perosamine synthetase